MNEHINEHYLILAESREKNDICSATFLSISSVAE